MTKRTCLLLIWILGLWSCKDSGLEPESADKKLAAQLVGSWTYNSSYRIVYRADGTFSNTIEGGANGDPVLISRQGRYEIVDGIVRFPDLRHIVRTASGRPAEINAFISPQRIGFSNDTLLTTSLDILSSSQRNGSGIAGTWTYIQAVYFSPRDSVSGPYNGRIRNTYTFYESPTRYKNKVEYMDGYVIPSDSATGTYNYSSPSLVMNPPSDWTTRVEFVGNEMRWYYDWTQSRLARVR